MSGPLGGSLSRNNSHGQLPQGVRSARSIRNFNGWILIQITNYVHDYVFKLIDYKFDDYLYNIDTIAFNNEYRNRVKLDYNTIITIIKSKKEDLYKNKTIIDRINMDRIEEDYIEPSLSNIKEFYKNKLNDKIYDSQFSKWCNDNNLNKNKIKAISLTMFLT